MTLTELASLEALAKAATPGPWYLVGAKIPNWTAGVSSPGGNAVVWICDVRHNGTENGIPREEDAAYIAAANPAAILSLIEENKRMREALTPSAETKAAYIGEFRFSVLEYVDDDGTEYESEFTVPWTTIKEIMAAIRARAALEPQS